LRPFPQRLDQLRRLADFRRHPDQLLLGASHHCTAIDRYLAGIFGNASGLAGMIGHLGNAARQLIDRGGDAIGRPRSLRRTFQRGTRCLLQFVGSHTQFLRSLRNTGNQFTDL